MGLSVKQKQNHGRREQTGGYPEGGVGEVMEWEAGISRCKLLCIEWISSKALLYNTENCIQYPVIKHNGKEYIKEGIYVYV